MIIRTVLCCAVGVQSFGRQTIWATDVSATFSATSHNLTNCVMGNKHKCSINSNKNRRIAERRSYDTLYFRM